MPKHEYDPTLQSPAERRSLLSQGVLRLRRLFVQVANITTLRTDTITERTSGAGVTVDSVLLKAGILLAADGAAATPSISFANLTDAGMYKSSVANTLSWATGGVERMTLDSASLRMKNNLRWKLAHAAGGAANPNYTFGSDENTGMYRVSADVLGLTAGGTLGIQLSATALNLKANSVVAEKSFGLSGDISPAELTANTDDWNPTDLNISSVIRVSTDASRDLTGIVPASPDDGRVLIIHNIGAQNLVLKDASGSSTAANRFALSGDITLAGDDAVTLQYDTTTNRWRAIGSSPGGAGGGGQDLATDTLWAAAGDLVKGTGDDTADILTIGADHTILVSNGSVPSWSAAPPLANIADTGDTNRITINTSSPHVDISGAMQIDDGIGIRGTAPVATADILANRSITGALGATYSIFRFSPTLQATDASWAAIGFDGTLVLEPPDGATHSTLCFGAAITAQDSQLSSGESATIGIFTGVQVTMALSSGVSGATLTVNNAYGVNVSSLVTVGVVGTLNIANIYGFRMASPVNVGATIDNTYGLWIGDLDEATNNYGIYILDATTYAIFVDAGLSRFDGDGSHILELPADATANGAAQVGRFPVQLTGGGTGYLYYYGS